MQYQINIMGQKYHITYLNVPYMHRVLCRYCAIKVTGWCWWLVFSWFLWLVGWLVEKSTFYEACRHK
jgi:hypothetical protein